MTATSFLLQSSSAGDWWSDTTLWPTVVIVIFFTLVSLVVVRRPFLERREGEQRSQVAARLGLVKINCAEVRSRFGAFQIVSESRTVQAFSGVVSKTPIFLFVQRIHLGEGHFSHRTCVGIESSTSQFPQLSANPSHLFGTGKRSERVKIPEARTFNAAYSVFSTEPESAKLVLTKSVRSLLEASDYLVFECIDKRFLSYRGHAVPLEVPSESPKLVEESIRLFRRLSDSI